MPLYFKDTSKFCRSAAIAPQQRLAANDGDRWQPTAAESAAAAEANGDRRRPVAADNDRRQPTAAESAAAHCRPDSSKM